MHTVSALNPSLPERVNKVLGLCVYTLNDTQTYTKQYKPSTTTKENEMTRKRSTRVDKMHVIHFLLLQGEEARLSVSFPWVTLQMEEASV